LSVRRSFGTQLYTLGLSSIADPGVLLNSAAPQSAVACSTALPRSPFTSSTEPKWHSSSSQRLSSRAVPRPSPQPRRQSLPPRRCLICPSCCACALHQRSSSSAACAQMGLCAAAQCLCQRGGIAQWSSSIVVVWIVPCPAVNSSSIDEQRCFLRAGCEAQRHQEHPRMAGWSGWCSEPGQVVW
jgi:hypothetical protein